MLGSAEIIKADSRHLPLADNSVDLVITSPPYFSLRAYADGGEAYDGQIGAEQTPAEYVDNLLQVTAECVRVLKPTGSIFWNLGDKYASGDGSGNQNGLAGGEPATRRRGHARGTRMRGIPQKSLIGLPWRYALRCIDELGLILRAEIIWSKLNGLPESVTDRVRRSHETWFHFTVSPRYFSAVDTIREEHSTHTLRYYGPGTAAKQRPANAACNEVNPTQHRLTTVGALGKLPGSVWTIPTEPLRVPDHLPQHFAAYPTEWPRRIILGWSPSGVCVACGEGRRPIAEADNVEAKAFAAAQQASGRGWNGGDPSRRMLGVPAADRNRRITGEACACPDTSAPTTPATILDPFGGTGTTALVAKALGRNAISVDMSADYCRLAEWRVSDPGELAKAMRVEKPPKPLDGQIDLFDGVA